MLKTLNIKNYILVENLTVDFDKGFNVFTGETGAGKSIIIGALSLLTRGRADPSLIKKGKDKAIIEGIFSIEDETFINKLKQQDIDVQDNEVIVKRVISQDNHNSIKINESSVTLGFLEDLFATNVDIHSQKDNHFLYNKKNQLSLLDKYAKVNDLLKEYQYQYVEYKKLEKEYEDLLNDEFSESQLELYNYDYNELDNANLSVQEEIELENSEKRYKSSEKYINALKDSIGIYDNDNGIKEKFYDIKNLLEIDDEEVNKITSKLNDIYYELDDEFDKLKNILNSFANSDLNIEEIEERLYLYSKLKRKHKTNTEGLLALKNELKDKLALYEDRDRVLSEKKAELDKAYNLAMNSASKLSAARNSASITLIKSIEDNAKDLLLNNFKFEIHFNQTGLSEKGIDDVEFYVATNLGEETKPLKNIASGGEISRILLALKVIFSKLSNTELLILDEIDTGVSGKVALSIGQKIAKISKDVQTIVITHLAPVAACANQHYLIYKSDSNDSSITYVKELNKEEIIEQLAIISNTSTDESALDAARNLYETSQRQIEND